MSNQAIDYSDRRSVERFDVNVTGKLFIESSEISVRIIDVSVKGMKIWGQELAVNQEVTIDTRNCETIHAKVVWAIGEAAGLKFANRISENHPLMRFASE